MSKQILPFYLVCDESASMGPGRIQALNDSLRQMSADATLDPAVTEKTMFSVIGFGEKARVVLSLADFDSFSAIPRLRFNAVGGASYSAAFEALADAIAHDVRRLDTAQRRYAQPAVFFLTGGKSADAGGTQPGWVAAYRRLTDSPPSTRPRILAFGDESPQVLRRIGNTAAFTRDPAGLAERAMREFVRALRTSIFDSVRTANSDGEVMLVMPVTVRGFTAVTEAPAPPVATPARAGKPVIHPPAELAPERGRAQAVAHRAQAVAHPPAELPAEPGRAQAVARPFPEPSVLGPADPGTKPLPGGLPDDRYKVPDTVLDGADLHGLSIRAVSLRGERHQSRAVSRGDAMEVSLLRDGESEVFLGCVAMGVDGQPLSHLGAAEACRLVREEARPRLAALFAAKTPSSVRPVCQDLVESVSDRLSRRASFLRTDPAALSTALAAVAVEVGSQRGLRRFVAFAVGDCSVLTLTDGDFHPVFPDKKHGEGTASTLPARPAATFAMTGTVKRGTLVLACTNGLHAPLGEAGVREQLVAWWSGGQPPDLQEFGWQLSFRAKSYEDDRTAVCCWAR
jgi:Protein phosphatase 2C/von Willebrand factor type A domain